MEPIYKWTGGKRKDIKHFEKYLPDYVKNKKDYVYVEPFFGAGALYWYLENEKNIINDIDVELINFINVLKTDDVNLSLMMDDIDNQISQITKDEKDKKITFAEAKTQRGLFFYEWRNKDRKNGLKNLTDLERAFRFILVNQWAFNGMRRFNSRGEFNVPYGNYKQFKRQYSQKNLDLLNKTDVYCDDYKNIISQNDNKNTFIFLDPPYTREFKEYSHENSFGEEQQKELANVFKNVSKSDIMMIINKDDFTEGLYQGYVTYEYDFKYATNIKNRYSNDVKHLVITNY